MLELTDQSFKAEVLDYQGVAVCDFWAPWCGPCRNLAPHFEELSTEFATKAKFGKINIDDNQEVAASLGIMTIPTILFVKNGQIVDKHVGSTNKQTLADKLQAIL